MKLGFGRAVLLSLAVHGLLSGAGYGYMAWKRHRELNAMDIDLSRSSLMPLPAAMAAAAYKPPEQWYVGDVQRLAPRPLPPPKDVPLVKMPVDEPVAAPCPPPCPSNAGDWASSANAVKKPEWLDGMISEDDYPQEARYKNITGLVVVQILLDADGVVRDAKLLQGSDPLLNDKTLEKVRAARFSPCVDGSGKPFPCTLRLPINWTLD